MALVTTLNEPVHATGLPTQEPPTPELPLEPDLPLDPTAPSTPLIGPQSRYPAWLLNLLRRPTPYTTMAGFVIQQTADTGDNGLDANHIYNGDRITYTITLSNTSGVTLNNINVVNILPRDALAKIVVANNTPWEFNYETITYLDHIGIEETITATREISWSIAALAHGQTHILTFSGNVMGQEDNTTFTNRVFALYYPAGSPDPGSASAAELPITAHMRIPVTNLGGMTISSVATWLSRDMGGTLSHDWGDFDRDGDLDLVLGSALGTTIYRNDNGRLNLYWVSPLNDQGKNRLSYGVRWADLNPANDYLELVAVGDVVQRDATFTAELPGINYVYVMTDTTKKFITMDTFTSTHQLMRVEAGDFDGSGLIDLVASTNVINAECPVILFRNMGNGNFSNAPNNDETHYTECLSGNNAAGDGATAAIAAADFDNDGDLDLAIGVFPATLRLLINSATNSGTPLTLSNPFTATPHIDIETTLQYIPYDLAWGDFDGDGYLDLAAAYPLQRTARVYRNLNGTTLQPLTSTIRTDAFFTPRALDWGDFNADGRLDLVVANEPPGIYQYNPQTAKFEKVATLDLPAIGGQVWSLRGAAMRDAGSLNLLVSNRDGPSQLYTTFGPKLRQTISSITTKNMSSVAWGDVDGDGDLDLLYGSGLARLSSQLQINKEGNFSTNRQFLSSGFGPHAVAFGDMTANGALDIAIGTLEKLQIYTNVQIDDSDSDIDQSPTLTLLDGYKIHSLAWGDPNDDGKLDLLVGAETPAGRHVVHLFLNRNNLLQTTPALTLSIASKVQSLLWKDFDRDYYLDFAVGQQAGPTLIYKNNGDLTFSPYWNSGTAFNTRSLDAADYNNNGYFDLIEGNFGAYDVLWENRAATQPNNPFTQVFTFTTPHSQTTSVAWGDWDNDGYPDLAVGTYNAYDSIYANRQSAPGAPAFSEAWRSQDQANTTGIAWGDRDNDGDLDLAVSRTGGGWSGIYENVIAHPAHIFTSNTSRNYQLPNDPPYVYIERPGVTADAYQFSSGNVMAGPTKPTVEIHYRLFDPEEQPIVRTIFEYSLDGGTQWRTATPADPNFVPITRTSINGLPGVFTWNAAADQAISDDARFRIRVIPIDRHGPVQRAANRGISPPFRVRATTCTWPADMSIKAYLHPTGTLIAPRQVIQPQQEIRFEAHVEYISGNIFKQAWTFGDGASELGLSWPTIEPITHVYATRNAYTVTARIDGDACPVARPGFASRVMYVGVTRALDKRIYLPLVLKNYRGGVIAYNEPTTWPRDTETELALVDTSGNEPAVASAPPTHNTNAPAAPQATSAIAMPPNTIRITDSPLGVDSQPAINNDGTRIAFWSTGRHGAANDDGNIEIFLAREGAAHPLQLTNSRGTILGGFNLGPTINGDGNYVAFFSDQDLLGANNTGATVVRTDTGEPLAQENRDRNFEIFMAEIDSNQVSLVQLTDTTSGENILPSMNDSGRRIAFASSIDLTGDMKRGAGTGIFVAEITRTQGITWNVEYIRVVAPDGANDQPAISGDGRFVAFVSDQDHVSGGNPSPGNNREIFVAELENGAVQRYIQVTQTPEWVTNEQPSIVARQTATNTVLNVVFLSDYNWPGAVDNSNHHRHVALAVITLTANSNVQPMVDVYAVPQAVGEKDYPNISATGGRIAYISTADQKLHLYDTFEEYDIAENAPVQHAFPALSADGTRMAFVANWDIYRGEYPLVDLALVKSADRDEAKANEIVTYIFTATNIGPSPATDVKIVDNLPPGMEAQLITLKPNTYRHAGEESFSADKCNGCTHHGTGWETAKQALTIANFGGRVFPLPDRDTPHTIHWTDMRDNELLLHMESVPPVDVNTKNIDRSITVQGSPSVITGKIGNALVFNGTAALHVPNMFSTGIGTAATWMTWVRRDSMSPGGLVAGTVTSNYGWVIDFPSSSQVRFRDSIQISNFNIVREKKSDITPQVGEWFHLAITWRDAFSPNEIRIYINGREVTGAGSLYASGNGFSGPAPTLYIGREYSGNHFRGALDEVAFFSRNLTADELLNIYERQHPEYTAYFNSALMQGMTGNNAWSTLAWQPSLPMGVELPDNGANWTISDTQALANSGYRYPTGTLAMSGTVLLLHMNEASGATSFFDTSGARDAQGNRNEAYCDSNRCPQAAAAGRFNEALHFNGINDYIYIKEPKAFATTKMTVMFWARTQASSGGLFQYSVTDSPSVNDGVWRFQENEFAISGPGGLQVRIGGQIHNSTLSFNDGKWHHIAVTWDNAARTIEIYKNGSLERTINNASDYTLTPPHNDARFAARVVLGNQLNYTYNETAKCFWIGPIKICEPSYIDGLRETHQNPFNGTLDELAVFQRALTSQEVRAAYLRGTARLLFQVRTCTTAACNGADEYFVGPGGLRHTYYTDEPDFGTPVWSLAGIQSRPYLQYRTYMDGFIPSYTPELITVTVRPRAECGTNLAKSVITCTLSTHESPLPVSETVVVQVPVSVTYSAFVSANVIDGQFGIHNHAMIFATEADHYRENNLDSWPLLLEPTPITAVNITPDSLAWELDETHLLTASVTPGNATPPVWYEWVAPLHETQQYTITTDWFNHTVAYSYTETGVHTITVRARNTPNGVWQTDSVTVKINHPQPHINSITPEETDAYEKNTTIIINGHGFVNNTVTRVLWNGAPLDDSNVQNSTSMNATIPAANLLSGGVYIISVRNAEAGLDTRISNTATFTVYNRIPAVTGITPVSTTIDTATPFVISGDYFAPTGVIVRLHRPNGTIRNLIPISFTQTQVNVNVPAIHLDATGQYTLTVQNPTPHRGNGESAPLSFTVNNRIPTVTSVAPNSTTTNTPTTVNITGNYFVTGATVRLYSPNGTLHSTLTPTTITGTALNVNIPGIQTAGHYTLRVQNPAPHEGSGESAPLTFTVNNPQPTITSFSPLTTTVSTGFTLTINGSHFVANARIHWNGATHPTTVISATQLRAIIPDNLVPGTAGNVPIFVRNPAPRWGDSNTVQFPVE